MRQHVVVEVTLNKFQISFFCHLAQMSSTQSVPPDVSETSINGTANESTKGSFSLENILGEHHDDVEHPTIPSFAGAATGWDEEQTEKPLLDGYCEECEGLLQILQIF
jgi:hypothetical protein